MFEIIENFENDLEFQKSGRVRELDIDEFIDEIENFNESWQEVIITKLLQSGYCICQNMAFSVEQQTDRMNLNRWWQLKKEKLF